MRVEVSVVGSGATETLREQVRRQVHRQLSRFGLELRSVVVWISGCNDPDESEQRRCHVTVRGPRLTAVTVDEGGVPLAEMVDAALQRAAKVVGRQLERARRLPTANRLVTEGRARGVVAQTSQE